MITLIELVKIGSNRHKELLDNNWIEKEYVFGFSKVLMNKYNAEDEINKTRKEIKEDFNKIKNELIEEKISFVQKMINLINSDISVNNVLSTIA